MPQSRGRDPVSDLEARIAEVVAGHVLVSFDPEYFDAHCGCGLVIEAIHPLNAANESRPHSAHLAAMLAPVIREREAEAWDKGADLASRIYPLDYDGSNPYRSSDV